MAGFLASAAASATTSSLNKQRHMFLPPQLGRLPASMSSIDSESVTIASLGSLENNRQEGGARAPPQSH